MNTQQFTNDLNNANTIKELADLRNITGASRYVCNIKEKIRLLSNKEGYTSFNINMQALKRITIHTDCGTLINVIIPSTSRILSAFAGHHVTLYVNHKEGTKKQIAEILIKSNNCPVS